MRMDIKKIINKVISLSIILCLLLLSGCGETPKDPEGEKEVKSDRIVDNRDLTPEEYTFLNTISTDVYGRESFEADGYREGERYVGIWYSLWLGQHQYMQTAVYDNTVLLSTEEGSEILNSTEDNEKSRMNEFHFCAKPLYGYYNMQDPWVVRRHIELLTMAGIDYLCFDTTNAIYYPEVTDLVLNTLLEFQSQGFKVPKAMFYVNSYAGTTARKIYNAYYRTEKYDDIWFSPNGKPMICSVTKDNGGASDQVMWGDPTDPFPEELEFRFDLRESQWPQGIIENQNALPWMTWKYPQNIHENLRAISVSVAQHDPYVINFSAKGEHSSRGYDHEAKKLYADYEKGQNFESQWKTVFNYEASGEEVKNVLVTGWNEWMAIKTFNGNDICFCDVYTDEYSRDIEMMDGSCGDNFYLQLMRNIRKYKLTDRKKYKYQKVSIDLNDNTLSQWLNVKAHYRDFSGDAIARDFEDAVGKGRYVDNSNRNDITDIKVVHNSKNIYFYVQTKENITEHVEGDLNWMNILISTGKNDKTFEGYDFIINRNPNNGVSSVEKSTGGYNFSKVGECKYVVLNNVIVYSIPLERLGLNDDNCYIKFKVFDNVTEPENILNFYISGDSAPIGRLSFSYGY